VVLVQSAAEVATLSVPEDTPLAYVTQTTLSVEDTAQIVAALRQRFPQIAGPQREDICYATTNRQAAVRSIAGQVDALLVLGAPNSSNSVRLVEVAKAEGCRKARLLQEAAELDWDWLAGVRRLGISAGASAPESLVRDLVARCAERYCLDVQEVATAVETTTFKLPRPVAAE
jgi:4-hydroxy-3-methylbut-2-enyl diphosphate reductase